MIDPQWFGTAVVGRVLAPDTFPVARPRIERDGTVALQELERVLEMAPEPLRSVAAHLAALEPSGAP